MSKSSTDLLSDLRASLEHQSELYGALVFQDSPLPSKSSTAPDRDTVQTVSETPMPENATLETQELTETDAAADAPETDAAADAPGPDAPENDAATDENLFGESIAEAPSPVAVNSPYANIGGLIPLESPLRDFTTLEQVSGYVASTVLIPLDEQRTNAVFGVGNPHADLMVIGEAPGAEEDRQGEPFVGRAGQLLTKILQAIGFERSDVYIANILKSRPPNNRDPLPAEVEAHIPILYKQIALIQPKILLCVGKTAGTSLLNQKTSLANLRGKFHDYHGLPVLVTYHPAALLRNSNWKRPTWEDVQLLRTRYDELGGS